MDAQTHQQPAFLVRHNTKTPLASQTFDDIASEDEVHEVHEYLFGHYVLLGQVIAARKLHHKHFFSLEMDYGHKTYLDRLVSTRRSVLKALKNPERRTAELLYEQEKQEAYLDEVWKELLKRTAPVKDEDITELVADITEGYEDESAHLWA